MSQENVETLRRMYETGSRGDWESAFRQYVHPDCEARFVAGPQAGTHRGHEAVLAVISDITAGFDAWALEPLRFFESEDRVVVIVRHRLRPRGTGSEFDFQNGQIWTFRDGKIESLLQYPSPEEALQAAGLSE